MLRIALEIPVLLIPLLAQAEPSRVPRRAKAATKPAEKNCRYQKLGVTAGPVSMSQLRALARTRQVGADTEVDCGDGWTSLGLLATRKRGLQRIISLRRREQRARDHYLARHQLLDSRLRSGQRMRSIGWKIALFGSLAGAGMSIGGIVNALRNFEICVGWNSSCESQRDVLSPVLFFGGVAVGVSSLVTGLVLYYRGRSKMQEAKEKFSSLPTVNVAVTSRGGAGALQWRF